MFIKCGVENSDCSLRISSVITAASWKVWKAIYEAYKCSNDGHHSSSNFDELLQTANLCSSLLRSSIKICEEDEFGNSERYEYLIEINDQCMFMEARVWNRASSFWCSLF